MSYYSHYWRRRDPYWDHIRSYLTRCAECGKTTSKKFSRANNGRCKACVTAGQAAMTGATAAA